MNMPNLKRTAIATILKPLKKPIWYTVHTLTGIHIQMPARYFDASLFSASFRAPFDKVRQLLPSSKLSPLECAPGMAEILIGANEFRHIDILYPYNEVAIAVPVSYKQGEGMPCLAALWYLHLPVTTEDARWPGVENFGFPKFIAEITFDDSADYRRCHLLHNGREILTVKVKRITTSFQAWEINNITRKGGELLRSLFQVQGQRGVDETPGGGTCGFGDHPIAEELQSLGIEMSSFRHEYVPQAQAILKNTRGSLLL